MGPENGGLVLDVSDGGLSFHSVAPVQPSEKIQFLLSLRGHSRIEGTGEVVWTNEMKTICGLKFITLSSGAREHINTWTSQSTSTPQSSKKTFPPTARPAVPAKGTDEIPARQFGLGTAPVFAIRPAYDSPLTVPDNRAQAIWREPLFLLALLTVLGAVIGVSAYRYGVQVGKTATTAPAQSASGPAPQTSPESAEPPPGSSSASTEEEARPGQPESNPITIKASPMPAGTLVNASKTEHSTNANAQVVAEDERPSTAPTDRTEQQVQAGQSELAAAKTYLSAASGVRDSAKAARLLWAAVGNGNPTAEVLLADLYVRGDGVAKNCEQGRILLIAAIKSGNIEAQQKLKDLTANGCKE